jgi:hypothetical protein
MGHRPTIDRLALAKEQTSHRAEPNGTPVPPRKICVLSTDRGDPLNLGSPYLFGNLRFMIEELVRFVQVQRCGVHQVPVHHAMRRIVQQRCEIPVLIELENWWREVIISSCWYYWCG